MSNCTSRSENPLRACLRRRYDRLWTASIEEIRAGKIEGDPVLKARAPDRRRGLTVIARPSSAVQERVALLLRALRRLAPDEYYYSRSEFHLTILSLFTATVHRAPLFTRAQSYVTAVDAAVRGVAPIWIDFEGVTVSPGTVMIQGFFDTAGLDELRESLRSELRVRGLAGGLDRRYVLRTAHMTVVRFRAPLRRSQQFAALLESARGRRFGSMLINSLCLVENDWYMSRQTTEVLKRYKLNRR